MGEPRNELVDIQPAPVTYKNPRRTMPEKSITLRHHRMAREASKRNQALMAVPQNSDVISPRRKSSDESNETGVSDPRKWFDLSNERPDAFEQTIDADPPFFQKETDSSNDEHGKYAVPTQSPVYKFVQSQNLGLQRPHAVYSSSADDYRSIVDDLTVENKRLREELKRYRQMGPDSMRREKLFEVKVHGLPSRKKRELEATLRDFTTGLDGSMTDLSPRRKEKGREKGREKGNEMNQGAPYQQPSSSSGSQTLARPAPTDSAYASMSTGPNSIVPSKFSRHNSDQAIERYLREIPEGLLPRSTIVTEKVKKKLVVKRLEQLFTGKGLTKSPLHMPQVPATVSEDGEMANDGKARLHGSEANREAKILPGSQRTVTQFRDDDGVYLGAHGDRTVSRENSNDSTTDAGGNIMGNRLPISPAPEQRPTRPRDVDPDRVQLPSENMSYIRHLGFNAPEVQKYSAENVSPDAEGWVYLNLLCNLAQLHILNVTPAFVRTAVSEKSKLFQVSPDGRKIRWRGGAEGTRFSSDSSGSNSQRDTMSDDTDGSNDANQRKKQKTTGPSEDEVMVSVPSKFGPQVSSSSDSFHYKPLFVHQQTSSSEEPTSINESGSSWGAGPEESNMGMNSQWNHSGTSGFAPARKRRGDGAIIYYTGSPFCTDLSGDLVSPDSNVDVPPLGEDPAGHNLTDMRAPHQFARTNSGSSLPFKPLSSLVSRHEMMDLDFADPPGLSRQDSAESDDMEYCEFPWSNAKQPEQFANLEASGLAGVMPEDHFVMTALTRRSTSQPGRSMDIQYLDTRFNRLDPSPLPPPAFFYGDAESDSDAGSDADYSHYYTDVVSRCNFLRRGSVALVSEDLSSGDEEDENETDNGAEADESGSTSPEKHVAIPSDEVPIRDRKHSRHASDLSKVTTGSSMATAGGAISDYGSMDNEQAMSCTPKHRHNVFV